MANFTVIDEDFICEHCGKYVSKLGYSCKKGFKHIALWGVALFYKLGIPGIYIKVYRFLVDKLKIDINYQMVL